MEMLRRAILAAQSKEEAWEDVQYRTRCFPHWTGDSLLRSSVDQAVGKRNCSI